MALLFAHGWFLRPLPLTSDHTVPRRQRNAVLRIPLFAAAWIAAALLLPAWRVAALFASWLARARAPGTRGVRRRFQHLGLGGEPA